MPQWKQYSGMWTTTQQMQAVGENNWPGVVLNELYAWGSGTHGQLGDGTVAGKSSPVQIGSLIDWKYVFPLRPSTSFAIKTDGTLWAWGKNSWGVLGDGTQVYRSSPVQIGSLTTWTGMGNAGELHIFGFQSGKLFAWGLNGQGQLGLGDTNGRSAPVQVGALTTWTYASGNDNSSAAIRSDGTMWSWGSNDGHGLLGRGENTNTFSSPVQIGALTDWQQIYGGKQFYLTIKTNGTLWAWGNGATGRLGTGDVISRSSPTQVGALTNWAMAACGNDTGYAVKTDGTLWSWGSGTNGGLGTGDTISRSSPVQIGALTTWTEVYANAASNKCLAVKNDGTLWTWGANPGTVGNNTTTANSSPVQVAGTNWATNYKYGVGLGNYDSQGLVLAVKSVTIS